MSKNGKKKITKKTVSKGPERSATFPTPERVQKLMFVFKALGLDEGLVAAFAFDELARQLTASSDVTTLLERHRQIPNIAEGFAYSIIGTEASLFRSDLSDILQDLKERGLVDPQTFGMEQLRNALEFVPAYQFPGSDIVYTWLPHVREYVTGAAVREKPAGTVKLNF